MGSIVIKVENLSKQYRLGTIGTGTIRSDFQRFWAHLTGKEDPTLKIGQENSLTNNKQRGINNEYVWALKDINFEVKQGEVLGIIGKNGAGKSTLLKILSKVTTPTIGEVKINGRIASLLEVGTGFHPELTGRENIFLNGAILGMTKTEIRKKFDEIVDFAGVVQYIDTPVKRYSSGMYVRLAFAVAAHLEPEILIIDEVLAVGDIEFQQKALGKMHGISEGQGRSVLFVSHNMGAIQKLCNKGLLMQDGKIEYSGLITNVIDKYININDKSSATHLIPLGNDIDRSKGYAYKLQIEDFNGNLLNVVPIGTHWQIKVFFTLLEKVNYFIIALGFRTMLDINIRNVYSPRMDLQPGNYQAVFKEKEIIYGQGNLQISMGMSSYEKAIHYVENIGIINFSPINNAIDDNRIIRMSISTILNPMDVEIIKI